MRLRLATPLGDSPRTRLVRAQSPSRPSFPRRRCGHGHVSCRRRAQHAIGENAVVADEDLTVELGMDELREITSYAVACAAPALAIFERDCADDPRPRVALDQAREFSSGGNRTKALRSSALAAHRAARAAHEVGHEAAADAARAAGHAAASAYLHPLAKATQVLHILGSAAHAARAMELDAGGDPGVGPDYIDKAVDLADPIVISVLTRYPHAPAGGHRAGELLRRLDASLRGLPTRP